MRDTVALEQKIEGNAIHSSSTAEFHCFMNAGDLLRVMGNKPTKGFDEVRSDIRMISVYKYFVVLLLAVRSVQLVSAYLLGTMLQSAPHSSHPARGHTPTLLVARRLSSGFRTFCCSASAQCVLHPCNSSPFSTLLKDVDLHCVFSIRFGQTGPERHQDTVRFVLALVSQHES